MAIKDQAAATSLYVLKDIIGTGGMGTVYRALDTVLHREVALKVLTTEDADLLERFVREREITAELDHPSFVRVLATGYLDGPGATRPFYSMPLIRGLTLDRLVARRREPNQDGEKLRAEFTFARLLQLVQQICLTMQSAHDKHVIHRDLKPANVIVGPYGEVYIMDLGLAKRLSDPCETTRMKARIEEISLDSDITFDAAVGTPYYMAPEQILTPRHVTTRADIFGLGAILYFVLTGRKPRYAEPEFDQPGLERRRRDLREQLVRLGLPHPEACSAERAPSSVRALVEEYEQVDGLLTGSTYHELRRMMSQCSIVPPSVTAAEAANGSAIADPVDTAIEAICMKALARRPEDRYDSCRAMWRELQQHLEGRHELIRKRRGQELTRHLSTSTLSAALNDCANAEQKLHEAIGAQEDLGRMGIEERLELLDLLFTKARLHDERGDNDAIVRTLSKAEPIVESTLDVVERRFVQVLAAKAAARFKQGAYDDAKAIQRRVIDLCRMRELKDLLVAAYYHYGRTCAAQHLRDGDMVDLTNGQEAYAMAARIAGEMDDTLSGVRARTALAELWEPRAPNDARRVLTEALRVAGSDHAAMAEAQVALGAFHLKHRDYAAAVLHAEFAVELAAGADAPGPLADALFVLGQARHFLGDGAGRRESFRRLVARGALRGELASFCAAHGLDPNDFETEQNLASRVARNVDRPKV